MNSFKDFFMEYRGAIIGIILIVMGAFLGNYVQRNKFDVKERIKNFIDKL